MTDFDLSTRSAAGDPPLEPAERAAAEALEALLDGRRPADEDSALALDLARLRAAARPDSEDRAAGARAQARFYARLEGALESAPAALADPSEPLGPRPERCADAPRGWTHDWARTLAGRPLVRLAAASLLVHLLALPVFAWWIAAQGADGGLELRFALPRERVLEDPERPALTPLTPADLGLDAAGLASLPALEPEEVRRRTRLGLAALEVPSAPGTAPEPELERAVRAWLEAQGGAVTERPPAGGEEAPGSGAPAAQPADAIRTRLVQVARALDAHARLRDDAERDALALRVADQLEAFEAPLDDGLELLRRGLLRRAELQGVRSETRPDASPLWKPLAAGNVGPDPALTLATWDPRPVLGQLGRSLEHARAEREPWRSWLAWAEGLETELPSREPDPSGSPR